MKTRGARSRCLEKEIGQSLIGKLAGIVYDHQLSQVFDFAHFHCRVEIRGWKLCGSFLSKVQTRDFVLTVGEEGNHSNHCCCSDGSVKKPLTEEGK